jgi:hypothetical protein
LLRRKKSAQIDRDKYPQAQPLTEQFAKIAALPSFEKLLYICSRVARREKCESRNFGKLPGVVGNARATQQYSE